MRHILIAIAVYVLGASAAHAQPATPSRAPSAASAAQSALDATIATYSAAWSEPDIDARRKMLEKVWADKGTYTDPTVHLEGREALLQHITGFHAKLPGAKIVATSRVDEHHGSIRFSWRMVSKSGTALSEGMDYGEIDAAGRITRIVGFFGPPAPISPVAPADSGPP